MSDALNELRAKYAAIADEANAKDLDAPKVLSIRTRKPWVAPEPEAPKRLRKPKTDKQAIEALTELLEGYRAGTLHGCCLVAWNTAENRLEQHVILPPGRREHEGALLFSGGAMMLNHALQDVAEFGMEAMAEHNDVVLMDGELEPIS